MPPSMRRGTRLVLLIPLLPLWALDLLGEQCDKLFTKLERRLPKW